MASKAITQSILEAIQRGQADGKGLNDLDLSQIQIPREVIKRVNALKNVQLKKVEHERKFHEELVKLECKYAKLNEPLLDERAKIISGTLEPSEADGTWYLDEEAKAEAGALNDITNNTKKEENQSTDLKTKTVLTTADESVKVTGIPDFWLDVFKNSELIRSMIQEYDEPILSHLTDIRVKINTGDEEGDKKLGYDLQFYFSDNEYFTNNILTKTYVMSTDLDPRDPFNFDGPEIYQSIGCKINWKDDAKNVTLTKIEKKQINKSTGETRTVSKDDTQDSFFNFFSTPTDTGIKPSYRRAMTPTESDKQIALKRKGEDEETPYDEKDETDEALCDADFEIGHYFKEVIITKATLFYTGEYDEEDYDDDDDDDVDYDEDNYNEDEDSDYEAEEDSEEEEEEEGDDKKNKKVDECKQN